MRFSAGYRQGSIRIAKFLAIVVLATMVAARGIGDGAGVGELSASVVSSSEMSDLQSAVGQESTEIEEVSRPNVVVILADDLGWGDVETHNPDSAMTTPNIDSIAEAGVHFTDAHSPSSLCSPTRYGLLTGRYAWRSWLDRSVVNGFDRPLIGNDQPTLGTLLQDHGYRTAAIGKWHLGIVYSHVPVTGSVDTSQRGADFEGDILDGPLDHGFDEFFGTSTNIASSPEVYIRGARFLADPTTDDMDSDGRYRYEEVIDDLTSEAVSFIERSSQNDEPFFLYYPIPVPHIPLAPGLRFDGSTGLGGYADFVAHLDWSVGQLLDAIEEAGVSDDTVVIFTSDNGAKVDRVPVPNHVDHRSNGGWRGAKSQIHEGGHRIPLFVRWPGVVETDSRVDATVTLTDLYATLADHLEHENAVGEATDSVSLLPLIRGETETRGVPVVHHSGGGMFAIRDGRWKLVFGHGSGLMDRPWNYQFYPPPFARPWELFDLEHDPGETESVASDNPDVMARLESKFNEIRAVEDEHLSSDSTLSSIRFAGAFLESFDVNQRDYVAYARNDTRRVVITAIPTATDAEIVITSAKGRSERRGKFIITISDAVTTRLDITVTSPDESSTTEYSVTLERLLQIDGTPRVGDDLTGDPTYIGSVFGVTDDDLSYQWLRGSGDGAIEIDGADSATYVPSSADVDHYLSLRVTFTRDGGESESLIAVTVDPVKRVEDEHLASDSSLSSISLEGAFLGSFDGSQLEYVAYTRNDTRRVVVTAIPATTDATIVISSAKGLNDRRGKFVVTISDSETSRVEITVTSPDESSTTKYSVTLERLLQIDGTLRVAEVLTADPTHIGSAFGVTGDDLSYQWLRGSGDEAVEIDGANSARYVPTAADVDHTLSLRVTFTREGGEAESLIGVTGDSVKRAHVEMTTHHERGVRPAISGFSIYGRRGSLTSDGWTIDGERHRVEYLVHRGSSLVLGLNREPPTDFSLQVGSYVYRASDSLIVPGLAEHRYWWPLASPHWSADESVPIGLTTYRDTTVGDRGKAPIIGHFSAFPENHDGREDFSLRINFSEVVDATEDEMMRHIVSVAGGVTSGVEAVGGEGKIWSVSITPANRQDAVIVAVVPGVDCAEASAVCTSDGRRLHNRLDLSIPMVTNNPAVGSPVISGDAEVGSTLTVEASGISDADGFSADDFAYQWLRSDGTGYNPITGAVGTSYTVKESDVDNALRLRISFVDDMGFEESLFSSPVVWERPHSLTARATDDEVELSWQRSVGGPHANMYRILRHRPELGEPEPLVHVDFTSDSQTRYTDADVEQGVRYVYLVQALDTFGFPGEASAPASVRVGVPNNPAEGAPSIVGDALVGETLTVITTEISDSDGIGGVTFRYRWFADDAAIEGATNDSYTVTAGDAGKSIKVHVSFVDDDGNDEALASEATPAVRALVTASLIDIPPIHDGQNAFRFELRFNEQMPISYVTLRDSAFDVVGGTVRSARRLVREGATRNLRWEITVEPDGDGGVSIALPATRDCDDDGAICAADGRMLSNRNALTVAGPGG